MKVERHDALGGRLDKFKCTSAGAVRVNANLTRTGVFEYVQPDGSVQREYKPEDEVFHADSLASFASIPVTLEHPPQGAVPERLGEFQKGHVSDLPPETRVRTDGGSDLWVRHALVISDLPTVQRLDAAIGDVGVSCGYECRLDLTPGTTPDGHAYDAIQRDIRYNHVAVLMSTQPRAGKGAHVHLDSKDMKVIKIDGKDYEYGSEAHIAKLEADRDAATSAVQRRLDAVQAKLDAATARVSELEGATRADAIDALVESRMDLLTRAARLLPADYETAGRSDAQVRLDAVQAKLGAAAVAGKSAEYIAARFDGLVEAASPDAPATYHKAEVRADASGGANLQSDEAFRAHLAKFQTKEA